MTLSISANACYKTRRHFILIFWILSFALGCLICSRVPVYLLPVMRTSLCERVSIVCLFVLNILPTVLFALSMRFGSLLIVYIQIIIKSLIYGFSVMLIAFAFCSAAWLVFLILFIPLFCDNVIYLLLALENYCNGQKCSISDLVVPIFFLITLILLDNFLASQFLIELLH